MHRAFRPVAQETESEPGIIVGRRPDPLGRVGVYAPGGRAAYPSSVLMGVVPARVAGVGEIVVCSPPARETGSPSDVVLAAAALAGADRVFALGGAGAIAAMAYGTASVPRVDRIVGPGNAYVAEAKLQVASAVAIDAPAGPSELLVVCDDAADPSARRARDAGAGGARSARRGRRRDDERAAGARRSSTRSRRSCRRSHAPRSAARRWQGRAPCCSRDSLDEAIAFANEYAPEHLLLARRRRSTTCSRALRNAGTVFVGRDGSVAFGDYMTGANHVLPTGGLARSYSGLSTLDFVRWTTYQRVTRDAAARLAERRRHVRRRRGAPGPRAAARAWGAGATR